MNKSAPKTLWNRLLADIAFGLVIIAAAVLYALLSLYSGKTIPVGWLGLVGFTPVLFWVVIKSLRRHWKRKDFWLAVAALLILHTLGFVATLLYFPQWPLLWFVPAIMIEAVAFVIVLGKLFDLTPKR